MFLRHRRLDVILATLMCGACGGSTSTVRPACPAGQTSLDGTCVTQQIADYVGCIRATGATVASDNARSLSAAAGVAGATASTQAEVKDKLEKRYATVSDANALEIIRHCASSTSATTAPSGEVVADSVRDFSGAQRQGGWQYGYSVGAGEFRNMSEFDGRRWSVDHTAYWTMIDAEVMHPNGMQAGSPMKREDHVAIRRWVSTVSGPIDIALRLARTGDCGNGATARVIVDGAEKWARTLKPEEHDELTQSIGANVHVGSHVDFTLDARDHDDLCDGSKFIATIKR